MVTAGRYVKIRINASLFPYLTCLVVLLSGGPNTWVIFSSSGWALRMVLGVWSLLVFDSKKRYHGYDSLSLSTIYSSVVLFHFWGLQGIECARDPFALRPPFIPMYLPVIHPRISNF